LTEKGIQVHDFVFADGEAPPGPIVDAWLQLIEARFQSAAPPEDQVSDKLPCITIHCVAGLGR
jgi:protein tyrosine phosphatase type 4A